MQLDLSAFDTLRRDRGLMTIGEIVALVENGNIIFDPFSVLISNRVEIGSGNIIHSCVTIQAEAGSGLRIGDGNTFHPNTLLLADGGTIRIGDRNQFGEGGFTARANRSGARITIGDCGRYLGGASVFGETDLGDGAQLLGQITVDNCRLAGGASWMSEDPDLRAALLKGHGTARGIELAQGQVIAGQGVFSSDDAKPQSFFHPKPVPRP